MSKVLTKSDVLMVLCLILSPIRGRDNAGNRIKLMPDGELTHKFDTRYAEWLASKGAVEIIDEDYLATKIQPAADDPSDDLTAFLLKAVGELDPDNQDHFTNDGKPEINALKKIAGIKKLSAGERDDLWEMFKQREAEKTEPSKASGAATEKTDSGDSSEAEKSGAGTGAKKSD